MGSFGNTPASLAVRLVIYFVAFFGVTVLILSTWPEAIDSLPMGGHDARDSYEPSSQLGESLDQADRSSDGTESALLAEVTVDNVKAAALFLSLHLSGTILLMIPITWTYMAIKHETGFNKNFARALIILPICASTIVLLIQDNLALAFGLAALVAAVRFRVALDEAIDGIFVFAAICVGLASGIGYLGIAAVMTMFLCFTTVIMWQMDYGENELDNARRAKKRAKMTQVDGP